MSRKSIDAKLIWAESLIELSKTVPIDDITINMLSDQAGRHHKTFYYHFTDKNQLITWLFRYELACELERLFKPEQLVYQGPSGDFPEFPFYARNIGDKMRIYNAPFFDGLYGCFEKRRGYYRNVFSKLGPGTLEHYMLNLYQPVLAEDIRYLIDRKLSEEKLIIRSTVRSKIDHGYSVDFLADFFTGAFVSRYILRLNYASTGRTAEDIQPFENVIHDSIGWIVHQEITHALERDALAPSRESGTTSPL